MTIVPDDYTTAATAMNEARDRLANLKRNRDLQIAALANIEAQMIALDDPAPAGYGSVATFINAQSSAVPAWAALKAELSLIGANFNTEATKTAAINDAINAVLNP